MQKMVPYCQNVGKTSKTSKILINMKWNQNQMAITKLKFHYLLQTHILLLYRNIHLLLQILMATISFVTFQL